MRNVVNVFYNDIVPGSGSGVVGSGILDEKEIMKLLGEEEMTDLELQVCGNVNDEDDQYKLDKEALNLALEEETRASRVEHEWLEKCRKERELDEEDERQL
nr:GPCR kinase [Tanacetum cinerariifolium]